MKKLLQNRNLFHSLGLCTMILVFACFCSEVQGQENASKIIYKEKIFKNANLLGANKFNFRLPTIASIKTSDEKILVLSSQANGQLKGNIIDRSTLNAENSFSLNVESYNFQLVKVGGEIALVSRNGFDAFSIYYLKVSNSQVIIDRRQNVTFDKPLHSPQLYYDFAIASINNQLHICLIDPVPFKSTYSGHWPLPAELSDCNYVLYWLAIRKNKLVVVNSRYVQGQPLTGGSVNVIVSESGNYSFVVDEKIISYDVKNQKWKQYHNIYKTREYLSANTDGKTVILVSVDSRDNRMYFEVADIHSLKLLRSFYLNLKGKQIYNVQSQIDSAGCTASYITYERKYKDFLYPEAVSVPYYKVNNMISQQVHTN